MKQTNKPFRKSLDGKEDGQEKMCNIILRELNVNQHITFEDMSNNRVCIKDVIIEAIAKTEEHKDKEFSQGLWSRKNWMNTAKELRKDTASKIFVELDKIMVFTYIIEKDIEDLYDKYEKIKSRFLKDREKDD